MKLYEDSEFLSLKEHLFRRNDFNFFEVISISDYEIRHSNVIAWLFTASEKHGLGIELFKDFINSIAKKNQNKSDSFSEIDFKTDDFNVQREENNIDIIIVSPANKTAFIIENKTGDIETESQLTEYRKQSEERFKNYKTIYIFLTASGVAPSDEKWLAASYDDLIDLLVKYQNENRFQNERVLSFVTQYIEMVRKNILKNNDLYGLVDSLYGNYEEELSSIEFSNISDDNNKEALSFILRSKSELPERLLEYTHKLIKAEDFHFVHRRQTWLNFLTSELKDIQDKIHKKDNNNWYRTQYSINSDLNGVKIRLFTYNADRQFRDRMKNICYSDPDTFNTKDSDGYVTFFYNEVLIPAHELLELSQEKLEDKLEAQLKSIKSTKLHHIDSILKSLIQES